MARVFAYALLSLYTCSILSAFTSQLSLLINYEQVVKEYCIYNDILKVKCNGACYEKHLQASHSRNNPQKNPASGGAAGKIIPVPAHLRSDVAALSFIPSYAARCFTSSDSAFPEAIPGEISHPPETGTI